MNLNGTLVKKFQNIAISAGSCYINWNGKNENNLDIPDGVYIYKTIYNGKLIVGRIIKISQ
jgi:flagellar hook assembly protein FlgD